MPLALGVLLVRVEQGEAQGVPATLARALQQRLIQAFYERFEADVLLPGSPLPYQDHIPHFVPLFQVKAHLVTHAARGAAPDRAMALLDAKGQAQLARCVSYGEDFAQLVARLEEQRRVTWVRDVALAMRMLAAQRADFTLISPTVAHALVGDAPYRDLRFAPLPGVRPTESGAAVSRRSMPETVPAQAVSALQAMAREGDVARAFARHFPREVLALEQPVFLR